MEYSASSPWQAWSTAVGVDAAYLALEISQIVIGDRLRSQASRFARPAIFGTLIGSAAASRPRCTPTTRGCSPPRSGSPCRC
jgi:hypothetical protein